MNPHDSIFFAPPITEVPDYVWSRQYDKPCFVPGRPIKNPQRHQPKDFTSRCRIGPACRKESLPPVPGSMVWPLFLQSRCCRIPGLRGHHGRGAPCRRTIGPKEGFGPIVPSTGGSAAQADIESGHPHPAGFNECPPGQYYFRLALFLVQFLQKTALLSVQSIIFAKNKLVWNSYTILSASNSP